MATSNPANLNIILYKENDGNISFLAKDSAGNAFDVSGYSFEIEIFEYYSSTPALTKSMTIQAAGNNEIVTALSAADRDKLDFGEYKYTLNATNTSTDKVTTWIEGKVTVRSVFSDDEPGEQSVTVEV